MQIYQNQDLDLNKFFVSNDDLKIVKSIQDIANSQLNQAVYFRPSNSPLINVADSKLGACYKNFYIPTNSEQFLSDGDKIVEKKILTQDLSFSEYATKLKAEIDNAIIGIYNNHATATLCLSGGIDSLSLLSIISRLGYLKRTKILVFENHTQIDPTCIHLDDTQKEILESLLDYLTPYVFSIEKITITHRNIENAFNNYLDISNLKCYVTSAILEQYHDTAFIFGYLGNQVLLHKFIFLDDIILKRSSGRDEIKKFLNENKDYYCRGMSSYDPDKIPVDMHRVQMLQKPWQAIDGLNKNRVYFPLVSNYTLNLLRRLDLSSMSVDWIFDAKFARKFLEDSGTIDIRDFVYKENLNDLDNLKDIHIPIKNLNPKLLTIPSNLFHDKEGLEYVEFQLAESAKNGEIPINSLVSVKNLNWLSSLIKN